MTGEQTLSDLHDALYNAITQIRRRRVQGSLSAHAAADLIEEVTQVHDQSRLLIFAVYRSAA